jgi:hypothetical protein
MTIYHEIHRYSNTTNILAFFISEVKLFYKNSLLNIPSLEIISQRKKIPKNYRYYVAYKTGISYFVFKRNICRDTNTRQFTRNLYGNKSNKAAWVSLSPAY